MKVYTNCYRSHWVSPYTIMEKLVFWKKLDILNLSPREEKVAELLLPLCNGWKAALDFIHPRIEYVKIDKWDTYDMRSTLAPIIIPMLKQLKETKHGVPSDFIHNKDCSEEIPFELAEKKWNDALDAMIWSFETELSDDPDGQFFTGNSYDRKGHEKWMKRKQKGFDLFGKYYQNLWD